MLSVLDMPITDEAVIDLAVDQPTIDPTVTSAAGGDVQDPVVAVLDRQLVDRSERWARRQRVREAVDAAVLAGLDRYLASRRHPSYLPA